MTTFSERILFKVSTTLYQAGTHPLSENLLAGKIFEQAQRTEPTHLFTTSLKRWTGLITGRRAWLDNHKPLSTSQRAEHYLSRLAPTSLMLPFVAGGFYTMNPGHSLIPAPLDILEAGKRYFTLLSQDVQNSGVEYPASMLRFCFADLNKQEVLEASQQVRIDMIRRSQNKESRVTSHPNYDTQAWGKIPYALETFHWRSWLDLSNALSWDAHTEGLFMGAYGPMQRSMLPPLVSFLKQLAAQSDRELQVVQIGAGPGTFAQFLLPTLSWHKLLERTQVDFIDISPVNREVAIKRLGIWRGQFNFRNYLEDGISAENLSCYQDNSVDVIVLSNLFHELPHEVRREAVKETRRVLRPGGQVIFLDSVQQGDDLNSLLDIFGEDCSKKDSRGTLHEPFVQDYRHDPIDGQELFGTGFHPVFLPSGKLIEYPFLAKLQVFRKFKNR